MKRQPIQFLECSTITSVTHKLTRKIGGKLPECVCVWRAANFVAIIARWLQPTAEQMNNRVEGAFESNKKWREIVLFCGQSTWNHPRALNRFTLFSLSSYCSFDYGLHCSLEINVDVRAHGKSQTIENACSIIRSIAIVDQSNHSNTYLFFSMFSTATKCIN